MNNMAKYYVHEIPEGYEARIEGNKVIIELGESEDEKTRKEIIKFIQDFCNPCDPDCDKWIAYLEKQKEQKPRLIGEDSVEKMARQMYETGQTIEEQKPAEWSEEDESELTAVIYCVSRAIKASKDENERNSLLSAKKWLQDKLSFRVKSLRPQPKVEWSEEDKEALDMCLDAIPKRWKTKSGILLTKWLKDNIHPQPKQEWSEEKAKSIIDDYEKTAWI